MKKCPKCSEEADDTFDSCWKCGAYFNGVGEALINDADRRAIASSACALEANDRQAAEGQVRPFVRCWARIIDTWTFICVWVALGFIIPALLDLSEQAFGFLLLFIWCFVEPICLSTWGATPGKALLRITVRNADGSMLSYSTALSRSFDVWLRGLGIGFPIVSFITQVVAYNKLLKNGITSWDQSRNLKVTHMKIGSGRIIIAVSLFIVFSIFMAFAIENA